MTSTVRPLAPRSTSPGLSALPDGMFSTDGNDAHHVQRDVRAARWRGARRSRRRRRPCRPSSVPCSTRVLIEMPPLSNVTPFPTSPRTGCAGAFEGRCSMTIRRGGSWLPRATPSTSPMPRSAIRDGSSTSTRSVVPSAAARARSARTRGGSRFAGSFTSSLARFTQPATRRARPAAAAACDCSSTVAPGTTMVASRRSSPRPVSCSAPGRTHPGSVPRPKPPPRKASRRFPAPCARPPAQLPHAPEQAWPPPRQGDGRSRG